MYFFSTIHNASTTELVSIVRDKVLSFLETPSILCNFPQNFSYTLQTHPGVKGATKALLMGM